MKYVSLDSQPPSQNQNTDILCTRNRRDNHLTERYGINAFKVKMYGHRQCSISATYLQMFVQNTYCMLIP